MNLFSVKTQKTILSSLAGAACMITAAAHASPILVFGQQGLGTPVTATASTNAAGAGVTTIGTTDTLITITAIDAPTGNGSTAYLTFSVTSTDAAVTGNDGNVRQDYVGSFSIYTGAAKTGTNLLSGSFTDLFEGLNASATIIASTPAATAVTFFSDVIPASDLNLDRAISLSFTGVTPGITTANANATIPSFRSAISGNFSADNVVTNVPEPASLALLGAGLVGAGVIRRRKNV